MVEEAIDSELNAVMHVPVVRIGVPAETMILAVADLVCISGQPDAMVPLALLCNEASRFIFIVRLLSTVHCAWRELTHG